MDAIWQKVLAAVIRRALDALGAYLVTVGVLNQADATQLVLALLPLALSLAWSIFEKLRASQKLALALRLPAGSTTRDLEVALHPQ